MPTTTQNITLGAALAVAAGYLLWHTGRRRDKLKRTIERGNGPLVSSKTDYDVLIVGAGPAGSTAAYFLGTQGVRVALCDKKMFPRDKPCGDAWCAPALDILEEMGVLAKMEKDGIVHPVKRGGLISPFGHECINTDGATYGTVSGCKTYAIKRYIADEYIVRAASSQDSVTLMEQLEVRDACFDAAACLWTCTTKSGGPEAAGGGEEQEKKLTARFLLICDGSTSYLAQKLGIIPKGIQPDACCSHAYIKNHTWTEKPADGVMIFNKSVLPGYSALFRHYDNTVYLGTYILPGGKATSRAIAPFEDSAIKEHPYIKNALGDKWEYAERRVVAPIRTGGVKTSYSTQCLLIGDAAGHVDPLTGEGIHTAMKAAKVASSCVKEMMDKNNYSLQACAAYHHRCYDAFGYEFWSSTLCAKLLVNLPIALDAVAVVGARRGQAFLDHFGECMTGKRPKSDFAQPLLLLDITIELVKQIVIQYVFRSKPHVPMDIGQQVIDEQARKKSTGGFA